MMKIACLICVLIAAIQHFGTMDGLAILSGIWLLMPYEGVNTTVIIKRDR